ncbi:hypothetical protein [Streptomyces sp. NPDC088789]|uniref:hypothetical protein n=1 Tax=Streptomyces sp. NPDC088789 TaxID=3365899 RepID=UPI00382FED1B
MVGVLACVVEREVCYHVDEPDEYREMGSGFIKAALHSVTEPGLSREEHHDATIAVLCTLIGQRLMMAGRDIGTLVELKDGTDPYGAGPLATKLTQAILRLLMLTPTNNPEGPFGPQHAKELLDQCRKDLQSARQLLEDSRRKVKRGR